jgi:hypothetical protein
MLKHKGYMLVISDLKKKVLFPYNIHAFNSFFKLFYKLIVEILREYSS